jgi:hypothetical protein
LNVLNKDPAVNKPIVIPVIIDQASTKIPPLDKSIL